MTAWVQWTARTIMLTAGFATAGGGLATAAFAQVGGTGGGAVTSGIGSVGGGNQVSVPITVPVDVCGNAIALLGIAGASCEGGAFAHAGGAPSMATSGIGSVGGGNQVSIPITAPVDLCGNAVGNAHAHCRGGAVAGGHTGGSPMVTSGTGSVLGGNQVSIPVTAPIDVCGNSVAVLGIAGAGCEGGSSTGTSSCGCRDSSNAITSLLPMLWSPSSGRTGMTSYRVPAATWPTSSGRPVTGSQRPARIVGQHGTAASASRGTLPLVAGLPSLAGLSSLPILASTPGAAMLLPQTSLSAAAGGGMSSTSFFTLAGGVLLAGISALKMSSRRGGSRRNGRFAS